MRPRSRMVWAFLTTPFVLAASTCFAQYIGWNYGAYYQSSTAQESIARGMADMVRSAGEARLLQSEAAKNYQEARARALENRLRATEVYHERRRIARAYWEARRRRRPRTERTFRLNRTVTPDPLGPNELDPVTGKINWPVALRHSSLAAERRALERLFARRAANNGVLTTEEFLQLQKVGKRMQARLRDLIRAIPTPEYIAASNFLKSLLYEPRRSPE